MKASRILILVLIIVGIYWFVTQPKKDIVTPNEIETQTVTNEDIVTKPSESVTIPEDTMDMSTDVGMEMPIPDGEEMGVPSDAKVFRISGKNFAFDTNEIRVQKGDTVVIIFKSTDGFHDWVVDAFEARTSRVQTGGETRVTFVADKTGTYEYYCSVGSHRANGMIGTLIVE